MSTYKALKTSNSSNDNQNTSNTDSIEAESIDNLIIINYQELNNKCDKVIDKIKNRKLKK
jgi:hypothetical protein